MSSPTYTGHLELRVLDGTGTEYVLRSAPDSEGRGLRAGLRRYRQSAEGGEVRLGDISLEALCVTLFGAADRDALPPPSVEGEHGGGYRAVLRHRGVLVLDGLIPRAAVEHDVQLRQWAFPLLGAAAEDFWKRLHNLRLTDLHDAPALSYREMPVWRLVERHIGRSRMAVYVRSDLEALSPELVRVYDLYSVVRAVFAAVGVALVAGTDDGPDLPPWVYAVRQGGQTAVREETPFLTSMMGYDEETGYGPGSLTLPDWTGRELVEAVVEATGWSLLAEYAPYPASTITLRAVAAGAALPAVGTLTALDGREAAGGYTRAAVVERAGTHGVRLAGGVVEASPEPVYPLRYPPDFPQVRIPAPPPSRLSTALSRWLWKPERERADRGTSEPDVDTIYESPFALAHVAGIGTSGALRYDFEPSQPSPIGGLPYLEMRIWGYPVVDDTPVLLSVIDVDTNDNGTREPVALYARAGTGTPAVLHPASAAAIYSMRSLPSLATETASGDWYVNGLDLRVGDPAGAVALGGQAWLVQEVDHRLVDDLAGLTLARPPAGETLLPEEPRGEPRPPVLRAAYYRVNNLIGQNYLRSLVVSWDPPPPERARFRHYEVRSKETEESSFSDWSPTWATSWQRRVADGETWTVEVRHVLDEGVGTAAAITLECTGANDANESGRAASPEASE